MIGSKVVCVEPGLISDMLKVGEVYTVIGIRDAGLCPPEDVENPDEIKIIPGKSERAKLGWWYQFKFFKRITTADLEQLASVEEQPPIE